MNKKMKRMCILLGILIVVCIAAVAASQYQIKQEQIATTEETILAVATGDATALSWEFEDEDADTDEGEAETGSFSFTLTDGAWVYDEDEAFPTSSEAIESLLEIFTEFTAAFIIEEVEDYSQYGLSDPCASITITTEDTEYVIELGDFSTMDEQRYVQIGDGNVYLVSVDPMDYYAVELSDLIENDATPSFDEVASIAVESEESYTISYEEESEYAYDEYDIYFTDVTGSTTPLDKTLVSSYLSTITSLDLTEYLTYSATEDDLTEYGFDDPELTLTVDYTDTDTDEESGEEITESGTFVLTVARDADQIAAAAEAETAEEEEDSDTDTDTDSDDEDDDTIAAYVRIGESAIIYGIDSDTYESLMAADYDDLCYQELMPMDVTEITEASVTIEGETYEFTAELDDDENQTWYYNEEEIDGSDFTTALTALVIDEFTDESSSDTEEISVTLTLDNDNYAERTITLYRYDGEYCVAEVDGEPYALVTRSTVVDLVEAVNAIVLN